MRTPVPFLANIASIRGICAVLVVIVHFHILVAPLANNMKTGLFINAYPIVDIFFVMSGFIMSHVYSSRFTNGLNMSDFKKYIGSRIARVYPLHLLTTLWAFGVAVFVYRNVDGMTPYFKDMYNPKALPASLLFLQSMHLYNSPQLNVSSWSLSAEWWMLLFFPALVPFFYRLSSGARIILGVTIMGAYTAMFYLLGPNYGLFGLQMPSLNLVANFGFLRGAAGFMAGMLFYEVYRRKIACNFFKQDWLFPVYIIAIIAAMYTNIGVITVYYMLPCIVLSASYNNTKVSRILNYKPFLYLGDLSFSVYMIHIPIMMCYHIYGVYKSQYFFTDLTNYYLKVNYLQAWFICAGYVAATILLSVLTYHYFELPARKYVKKLFKARYFTVFTSELSHP